MALTHSPFKERPFWDGEKRVSNADVIGRLETGLPDWVPRRDWELRQPHPNENSTPQFVRPSYLVRQRWVIDQA
jgi:hypothetical protein